MWAASAYVLALVVVLAQPVASLAWLDGAHATLEQAVLHEAALKDGHHHHHGAPGHHEHRPGEGGDEQGTRLSQGMIGPEVTAAAPRAALYQDLLQAALAIVPEAPMPEGPSRYAPPALAVPSQHSPPVLHRPPILLTFAIP